MAIPYCPYPHTAREHVERVGPTPLTEAYAAIQRRWYAEGKEKGPNHDEIIESSRAPWDAMSLGEREYASWEGLRIQREFEPTSSRISISRTPA